MKRQARSYSIVDHELLHGGYLRYLSHKAMSLYLFLVVVGDVYGRSFYSSTSIGKILQMDRREVCDSTGELLKQGLIDYHSPYWRILTLTYAKDNKNKVSESVSPLVRQILKNMES
ncbi:MAG: hypothetical protein ACUZ8H_01885 [Candidatus Anammoxibacter sp.]